MDNNTKNVSANTDPAYDMNLKKNFNPKADEKNFIYRGKLCCGAINSKNEPCKRIAGHGTPHLGYGRCKFHGGLCTGPKTPEGKAASGSNQLKHGFYSSALNPRERQLYEQLLSQQTVTLADEIHMLKVKILTYLDSWTRKEANGLSTKVKFKDGNEIAYYHAGTIEDRPLNRALETLGRLVDKHAKLNPQNADDIVTQLNAELRAASHGRIQLSWGNNPAQARKDG